MAIELESFIGRMSPQHIADIYFQRREAAGPMHSMYQEVQKMYNADVVVPMPEINKLEKAPLPNRVQNGLQQIGNRVVSQLPDIQTPALRPGIKESEQRARDRRRAVLGWWGMAQMKTVLRQRSRYFLGYSNAPVEIRWDFHRGVPKWEPHNPLNTYPAPFHSITQFIPDDCIFETVQSLGWIQDRFPAQATILAKGPKPTRDSEFTLLRYVDDFESVLVVLGRPTSPFPGMGDPSTAPGAMIVELTRVPNRSEVTPVVIPRLITLDRPHGMFNGLHDMFIAEATLMALSIEATRKGVFTEEWLIARPNEEPDLVATPNPAEGIPGVIKGADLVPRGVDPQFQTNITMDRLAEAQRMSAGLSSELQGVAPTNVRTGRRASQLLSASIDFTIQEAQEAFEISLAEENKVAIAFCKGYSSGSKSFYVNLKGARGKVTYSPETTFETDENTVTYSLPGSDLDDIVISAGQRIGMGTMSRKRFMDLDPLVPDAEEEMDRVRGEQLEDAFWTMVQSLASIPEGPFQPADFALLARLIMSDQMQPYEALEEVQRRAQERQAEQVPPGAPEAQPGLSPPGQGVEQPETIEGAPASVENLNQLLFNLRAPQGQL